MNIQGIVFNQLIGTTTEYHLHWNKGSNTYRSLVAFIESNGVIKPVILKHEKQVDGKYTSYRVRLGKSYKDIRVIKEELKTAAVTLKLENDYYEAMAYEEMVNLDESIAIDKWMKVYEYNNYTVARRRYLACKHLYNSIIERFSTFNGYRDHLEELEII